MTDFRGLPPVRLPGSEKYWEASAFADELERRFKEQDATNFAYACLYNTWGPVRNLGITRFTLLSTWVWQVDFDDDSRWVAVGSCDYTGWDCRSDLEWFEYREFDRN